MRTGLRRAPRRLCLASERYSALDAYVRHFRVVVQTDAVAHIDANLASAGLEMMKLNMDAELVLAADCGLD